MHTHPELAEDRDTLGTLALIGPLGHMECMLGLTCSIVDRFDSFGQLVA